MALKIKENRTIVLPIEEEKYELFITDLKTGHEVIKELYKNHVEFFPLAMSSGYMFNGKTRISKKIGLRMRKIKIGKVSYRIRPSFVLSYGRLATESVAHGLFLKRFGVPFWALATVFGHDAMWWYRLYISLGKQNIVSTSVYNLESLPRDLLADEHHIKIRGEKAYVATTVGENCFLGMEVSSNANEVSLEKAYGVFKEEALSLNADYQPNSVNTDGWWQLKMHGKSYFQQLL